MESFPLQNSLQIPIKGLQLAHSHLDQCVYLAVLETGLALIEFVEARSLDQNHLGMTSLPQKEEVNNKLHSLSHYY